jgi:hypothetical protein
MEGGGVMYRKTIPRLMACALSVASAASFAACGSGEEVSGAPPDDGEQVRAVFERVESAMGQGDSEAACKDFSARSKGSFAALSATKPGSCESGLATYLKTGVITEDFEAKVLRVKVAGARASLTARVTTSDRPQRASFVKEDGSWKVNGWLTD